MGEFELGIIVAIIGLAGVVIGGLITSVTNYFNNKREDKRFNQKLDHENKQQLRNNKLDRLYEVLIPIVELYEKSNNLKELLERHNVRVIGDGLESGSVKDLSEIIASNKRYMSLDLIETFNQAESEYEYHRESSGLDSQMWHLEQQGEQVTECLFDENKYFIKKVEQEAKEIEEKYN